VVLNTFQGASTYALREGLRSVGAEDNSSAWINPLFLGGYNFETPPPLVTPEGIKPFPPTGARTLDPRTVMFVGYTVITPAMIMRLPNIGSQYLVASPDANKHYNENEGKR